MEAEKSLKEYGLKRTSQLSQLSFEAKCEVWFIYILATLFFNNSCRNFDRDSAHKKQAASSNKIFGPIVEFGFSSCLIECRLWCTNSELNSSSNLLKQNSSIGREIKKLFAILASFAKA